MFSRNILPFVWMGERNFISRDLFLRSLGLLYPSSIKMQAAKRRITTWEGITTCTEVEDYSIRLFPIFFSRLRVECSGNGALFRPSGVSEEKRVRVERSKMILGPRMWFYGTEEWGREWTKSQLQLLTLDWFKRKRQEIMNWQSSWVIIIKFIMIMASL